MNFKGQNMCPGRLCWLTNWEVMESREVRPLKEEAEEVGNKKDCGLTMAEHQTTVFLFLSWAGERKFAKRYFV